MKEYTLVNILDMLEAIGEENLKVILSDFSCPLNMEIEIFVWHNAIEFAKKKMFITYFLVDAGGEIVAIFTLAHKAVEIGSAEFSSIMRKKLNRYAQLDNNTNSYTVSAFLIAQNGWCKANQEAFYNKVQYSYKCRGYKAPEGRAFCRSLEYICKRFGKNPKYAKDC